LKNFVGINRATLRIITIAACLGVVPISAIAHGGNKMEPLYNIKEAPELKPQEFKPGGGLFGTGWMTAGANNTWTYG